MSDLQRLDNAADDALRFYFAGGDNQIIVRLDGDLDATSVAGAWLALELAAAAGQPRLMVDCTGLRFVDVAGLRFLIEARGRAQAAGGALTLGDPPAVVRRMLEITGWQRLISSGELGGPGASSSLRDAPAATYQAVLGAALRISGARMGDVQLVDAATGQLRIVAHHGFGQRFLGFFATVDDGSFACGAALRHGVPVWVDDVTTSPIFANTLALEIMLGAGSRAVASVPICAPGGQVIAMVSAHHDHPVEWANLPRFQLEQLARLAGRQLLAQPRPQPAGKGPTLGCP